VLILLPPSEKKRETSKPTPAIAVYTGVLYQALDWGSLSAAAQKRGEASIAIISAKYGAIAPAGCHAYVEEDARRNHSLAFAIEVCSQDARGSLRDSF